MHCKRLFSVVPGLWVYDEKQMAQIPTIIKASFSNLCFTKMQCSNGNICWHIFSSSVWSSLADDSVVQVTLTCLSTVCALQVASKTLGIPSSKIYISETSTNTVPNTSPTAASASSDLNGMAVYVRSVSLWPVILVPTRLHKTSTVSYVMFLTVNN